MATTKQSDGSPRSLASPAPTCRGDHLIPDVLAAVFDFLDLNDLLRCMKTCRRWRSMSRDHPTFSRRIYLNSLTPGYYSRFIAQILHKDRTGGALWLKLSLLEDYAIPRKLREMLKRVWPRVVRFGIEAIDTDSMVAILGNPSPRLEALEFLAKSPHGAIPELTASFLGGHAPVLRSLMTMLVAIPPAPRLAVLAKVNTVYAGGYFVKDFKNAIVQFPRLQRLDIVDPAVFDLLDETEVHALSALDVIPHITLQFRIRPQWGAYFVAGLPLYSIRRLSIIIPQGEQESRGPIQAELLHGLILSLPGDLTVVMHTTLSDANPEYNFVVTSKDKNGNKFRRDIGVGIFLPQFSIPESICERIVHLTIYAPDWDRTCFWRYGLQRLEVFRVVFTEEALFRELLRPERKFRRHPVPMSYLRTTHVIVDVGKVCDVDFGLLHAFLRKGTMQPCLDLADQDFIFTGLNVTGEAKVQLDDTEEPTTLRLNVTGAKPCRVRDW